MTFPMGTMSLSNTEIGHGGVGNYPLLTFKVMGSIFAAACIFITVGVLLVSWCIHSKIERRYDKQK